MKKFIRAISIALIGMQLTIPILNTSYGASGDFVKNYTTGSQVLLDGKPIEIPNSNFVKSEELRGVWVSSVYNLDFPSKKGMDMKAFKKEYIELLDNVESLNMNSIIFQVRPKMDAFYPSKLNPWSEFLTGSEGKDPGWDPLKWMVEETHKRGLEFHAWFNPYRVTTSTSQGTSKIDDMKKLSIGNWARNKPDNVFKYQGKLYLNPGNDQVINYVTASIMEVVESYDIDGVHLDDYFYPNTKGEDINKFYGAEEEKSYNKSNRGIRSIPDWRRDNIDRQIQSINNAVNKYNKDNKKAIRFGVSPFGIWGHKENHKSLGSNTPKSSLASYDNQFADTRKWVKNNWVDYIAPQIYWTFEDTRAPYGELTNWWVDTVRGTDVDLYIGQASYKKADLNKPNSAWNNPREISNQLKYNSQFPEIKGSIFFKYKSFFDDKNPVNKEFVEILKQEHYKTKASIPSKDLLASGQGKNKFVENQYDFSVTKTLDGNAINWYDKSNKAVESYLIYRQELIDNKLAKNILIKDFKESGNLFFVDRNIKKDKNYIYSIVGVGK